MADSGQIVGLPSPSLRRVGKSRSTRLPRVSVYLDDVERIEQLLRRHCEDVELRGSGFVAHESADLQELKVAKIHNLTITGSRPYVAVTLGPADTSVYIGDDTNLASVGVMDEMVALLKERRAPLVWLSGVVNFGIGGMAVLAGLVWAWIWAELGQPVLAIIAVAAIGVAMFTLHKWDARVTMWEHSTVWLSRSNEHTSWFDRHGTDLLIAFGSAALGALLTVAATLVIGR